MKIHGGGGGFRNSQGHGGENDPHPSVLLMSSTPPSFPSPHLSPWSSRRDLALDLAFFKNLKLIIPRKEGAFPRSGSRPSARFIAELQKDLLEDSDWSIPGDRTTTNALLTVNTAGPDLIIGRGDRKPNRPRLLRRGQKCPVCLSCAALIRRNGAFRDFANYPEASLAPLLRWGVIAELGKKVGAFESFRAFAWSEGWKAKNVPEECYLFFPTQLPWWSLLRRETNN